LPQTTSIIEKIAPDHAVVTKRVLVALTGVGLLVSLASAIQEHNAGVARDQAIGFLTKTVTGIPYSSPALRRIEADMQQLLAHMGVKPSVVLAVSLPQFFVRIAADNSRERLQPFLNKLQNRFGEESGAVILNPRSGSKLFKLVWGQHLDRATAEQRLKAANGLGLPPKGQSAEIEPEVQ
jgi:hypothetical protein